MVSSSEIHEKMFQQLMELWHDGQGKGQTAAEFCGLTDQEYAAMVERRVECQINPRR